MFPNFDPKLFDDPSFKEDSVREVVIAPMLARLGYHPSGKSRVARSKALVHPFIFIGTTKRPVTIIPDYTLLHDEKPIFILDAKAPTEDVMKPANVQQAYSYAIHPEIRSDNFGLCNGRELVVFSTSASAPLLRIPFHEFDSNWETIASFLAPKFLLNPILRRFDPDAGMMMRRLGIKQSTAMVFVGARFNLFGKMSENDYTASSAMVVGEKHYAASFDFSTRQLQQLVGGLPEELRKSFLGALSRVPFKAAAGLCVEADIECHLGEEMSTEDETFIPLVITKVMAARFNPVLPSGTRSDDVPSSIYKLRDHFTIGDLPTGL